MADDDEIMEPDEELEPEEDVEELDGPELDEVELEEELDEAGGFEVLDEDFVEVEDDDAEEEDDDATAGPVRKSVAATNEEEDDDDEMLAPDDVEADLDTILKDRLVATEDEVNEDEEEPEDKAEAADRLQPKRADEQLCSNCFLLVRQTAPGCPVGDDDCPLFAAS